MKSIVLISALALAGTSTFAAPTTPQSSETTYGNCSPNMSRNSGTVTINCTGLDPAVAVEISEVVKQLSLLNKKTATERNQQLMIKTLKDIKNSLHSAINQPTFKTNGPLHQNSTGNCSPNMVGNNNTNVCGAQDLNIDADQAEKFTRGMSSIPSNFPNRKIKLLIEIQNHRTQVAGEVLGNALQKAGFDVDIMESYMIGGDNYGGISFLGVSSSSLPMANAITTALNQAGIVSGPVPILYVPAGFPPIPDFTIVVKRQQ